jgi:hypothetical protein
MTAAVVMLTATFVGSCASVARAKTVSVPIELVGNYPILSVDIEGHKVRLMFDLGEDSALVLTRTALDEIKIAPTGADRDIADVKGNTMVSPTFSVPHLQIGRAVFTNVAGRVDVHDPSYQSAPVGQQGYIGPNLLSSYWVVLDYRHGKMTLIPPEDQATERSECSGAPVPFLPEWNGAPVTKATTDFGDLTVVWDTGAPVSLIRNLRLEKAVPSNDLVRTEHFTLNGVDFGPLDLRPFEFSQPPGTDGFIGTNFFARHVVCIDLPGNRFLIQR